jgi:hypothetical protein
MGEILLGWIDEGQVVECRSDPWMKQNLGMQSKRRQGHQMTDVQVGVTLGHQMTNVQAGVTLVRHC